MNDFTKGLLIGVLSVPLLILGIMAVIGFFAVTLTTVVSIVESRRQNKLLEKGHYDER